MDFTYLLYSLLFAFGAIVYYQLYKSQIKDREARGLFGLWNYSVKFSSFLIISFLTGTSIVYLLCFFNIL